MLTARGKGSFAPTTSGRKLHLSGPRSTPAGIATWSAGRMLVPDLSESQAVSDGSRNAQARALHIRTRPLQRMEMTMDNPSEPAWCQQELLSRALKLRLVPTCCRRRRVWRWMCKRMPCPCLLGVRASIACCPLCCAVGTDTWDRCLFIYNIQDRLPI